MPSEFTNRLIELLRLADDLVVETKQRLAEVERAAKALRDELDKKDKDGGEPKGEGE
jgi:hypothetical protein